MLFVNTKADLSRSRMRTEVFVQIDVRYHYGRRYYDYRD